MCTPVACWILSTYFSCTPVAIPIICDRSASSHLRRIQKLKKGPDRLCFMETNRSQKCERTSPITDQLLEAIIHGNQTEWFCEGTADLRAGDSGTGQLARHLDVVAVGSIRCSFNWLDQWLLQSILFLQNTNNCPVYLSVLSTFAATLLLANFLSTTQPTVGLAL